LVRPARSGVSLRLRRAPFDQFLVAYELVVESDRAGVAGVELEQPLAVALEAADDRRSQIDVRQFSLKFQLTCAAEEAHAKAQRRKEEAQLISRY
jgi:hypothetical protein